MSNKPVKQVVIIGGFGHEGVDASLKSLGYGLQKLTLDDVRPKTWIKRASHIAALRSDGRLAATILYLHTTILLRASTPEYRPAFDELLRTACKSKTLIFAFQDNLDGVFAMRHAESRRPLTVTELEQIRRANEASDRSTWRIEQALTRLKAFEANRENVIALIADLYKCGAEVAPFFERSDVTIRLQEFLSDLEQGVFLRLYVPDDRFQAEQLKGLLALLERYLRQVEQTGFSVDSRKSERGVVYVFRTDTSLANLDNLNQAFERFDGFMQLCADDPVKAGVLLESKMSAQRASQLVTVYAKDYKRLVLDSRHEFERKTLLLRQKFENDVIEMEPAASITSASIGLSQLFSSANNARQVNINIGKLSVLNAEKISTEIDQVVNGSVSYNSDDKLLLSLFEKYADRLEALQCKSDLDQLKDSTTAEPTRQNAKQRLIGFLRKAAQKAGETAERVAVESLSRYLETLLKTGGS